MENNIVTPSSKGLLISLVMVAFAVIITILKQETNQALGIIPIVLLLGGIIWACLSYSKQMNGNVTFGNIFGHGFKATALVAGIMGLWVAISLSFIFPEALDRAMDAQREMMEKGGQYTDEQMDQAMTLGRKMAIPMGTIFSVIIYLAIGAIGALVGASLSKKNPNPQPFDNIG